MSEQIILVVDDDVSNLMIHVDYLTESENNYEVLQANNGELALKVVEKKKPDLILLDWEMPGLSGPEVISELKAQEAYKDIAIIIITGMMTSSENLEMALDTGAVDFLRKPVDKSELLARIRSMLAFTQIYKDKIRNEHKINELLKEQIDFKDRELASNTLFMTKQNYEVLNIVEELKEKTAKCEDSSTKIFINSTIRELKSKTNLNIWNDFKIRFEKVHPNFMHNLLNETGKLTPTEQKLAILLRLNLSSKEIADILSIQVESVKTGRSRLRKKLGITQSQNMVSFLSQF